MDAETALTVVRPLADGVDPMTGEALSADGPYQRPQIVRALMVAVGALEQERLREQRRQRLPGNAGMPWSTEEDEDLAREFDGGKSPGELAAMHGRTGSAIQARLVKLGRLSAAGE
jgi:hypothetical protein